MIRRGDLYWYDFGIPRGSAPGFLRPVVVIQNDIANMSAIRTTMVCILTTNLRLARARGNVLLDPGEGNIPQQSVVNVSQVATVSKSELTDDTYIRRFSEDRVAQVIAGVRVFI